MVKLFDLSDFNRESLIFWLVLSASGALLICQSLFFGFNLAVWQIGLLAALVPLSFVGGLFPVRIPQTRAIISASDAIAFLALVYLGVPAAVLTAGAGALAVQIRTSKSVRDWLTGASIAAVAAFCAGQTFYFALRHYAGVDAYPLANTPLEIQHLTLCLATLAATQFFLSGVLRIVLFALKRQESFSRTEAIDALLMSLSFFLGAAAAGAVQFAESKLGFPSGLISLPIVILPYLAYKMHFRRINEKNDEIAEVNRVQLATVQTLAAAVDAREQASPGHTRRVQIYAVGLGKALGLPAAEIKALEAAALLHDIGKLAVPDYILNKPEKLTRMEMDKVKVHSSVGAEILASVNFPYPVVPAVLHHHERWDGAGYPEGLRGEEIPAAARVLAIADVYDVLRASRPYRSALSREEARRNLIAAAGTQFDPKMVDVFLRCLKAFEDDIEAAGVLQPDERTPAPANEVRVIEASKSAANYFDEIKRANLEVFTLYDLARLSSSSLSLEETVRFFIEKVQELVPLETCVVYLFDEAAGTAVAAHSAGKNAALLRGRTIQIGEGVTGFVLKNQKSVCSVSPALDFTADYVEIAEQYTTMAALPLKAGDRVIGALTVYSENLLCYDEEHLRLLETVSNIASNAVWRAIQHAETESRALTDPMTNLPNARALQLHFEREVARSIRSERPFHVVMLDLDEFKKVNDTFGHKVGDWLLKEVSKVMQAQLREYDFLARYAGDEFVAVVPEVAGLPINELCARIEAAVKNFVLPVGNQGAARVGISIGAASYPAHGETLEQVLIAADQNMYSVKAKHKKQRAGGQKTATQAREYPIFSTAVN